MTYCTKWIHKKSHIFHLSFFPFLQVHCSLTFISLPHSESQDTIHHPSTIILNLRGNKWILYVATNAAGLRINSYLFSWVTASLPDHNLRLGGSGRGLHHPAKQTNSVCYFAGPLDGKRVWSLLLQLVLYCEHSLPLSSINLFQRSPPLSSSMYTYIHNIEYSIANN